MTRSTEGRSVISNHDIEARVRRLDELARGLAKEVVVIRQGNAIQDAIAGVEDVPWEPLPFLVTMEGRGGTPGGSRTRAVVHA
jgi:hypothetical protein